MSSETRLLYCIWQDVGIQTRATPYPGFYRGAAPGAVPKII